MYGYDKIPSFWLNPLKEVEDFTFEGTNMSLAKAYQMSFDQAKQLIVKTGGKVSGGEIEIPIKKADVLPLEQNFENTYPLYRERKAVSYTHLDVYKRQVPYRKNNGKKLAVLIRMPLLAGVIPSDIRNST